MASKPAVVTCSITTHCSRCISCPAWRTPALKCRHEETDSARSRNHQAGSSTPLACNYTTVGLNNAQRSDSLLLPVTPTSDNIQSHGQDITSKSIAASCQQPGTQYKPTFFWGSTTSTTPIGCCWPLGQVPLHNNNLICFVSSSCKLCKNCLLAFTFGYAYHMQWNFSKQALNST